MTTLGTDGPEQRTPRIEAPEGMLLYAWTAEVDAVTGDVEVQPFR